MAGSRPSFVVALCLLAACGPATRTPRLALQPTPSRSEPAVAAANAASEVPVVSAVPALGEGQAGLPSSSASSDSTVLSGGSPAIASTVSVLASADSAPAASGPVAAQGPLPPAWDIDVAPYASHARVEYFIERFSGPFKETFEVALARQSRYAPLIHARLRAAGLPEDMIFLPLIESWYDTHAYSRAAAVGMWQFMTSTARGVGLRVDWWLDERRDPVRATEGAVAYLNELRGDFGSVYLAAAAYNGGSGRVSRGLARHAGVLEGTEGDALFFALAEQKQTLRSETRDYVPKLIAAALVGKEPSRYALTVQSVLPFTWDSVSVAPAVPLAAVAKALDVPIDTLLDYNPQILRGMTPPSGPDVWLRVPLGMAADFESRLTALAAEERVAVTRVVTKNGDYMSKIARKYGLTAKELSWYNPKATRMKNGNLHAGQRLLVPRHDVVRAARDVPDPKIERYGSSPDGYHVVKRGESLSVIARKNGTSVARLKSLNRLKSDHIRIGQKLRVR